MYKSFRIVLPLEPVEDYDFEDERGIKHSFLTHFQRLLDHPNLALDDAGHNLSLGCMTFMLEEILSIIVANYRPDVPDISVNSLYQAELCDSLYETIYDLIDHHLEPYVEIKERNSIADMVTSEYIYISEFILIQWYWHYGAAMPIAYFGIMIDDVKYLSEFKAVEIFATNEWEDEEYSDDFSPAGIERSRPRPNRRY